MNKRMDNRLMKKQPAIVLLFLSVFGPAGSMLAQQPVASATQVESDPTQIVAPSNKDKQWKPTETQRKSVVQGTRAYFADKDGHRLVEAYARFAPAQKDAVSFEAFKADMEAFQLSAGKAEGRTLRQITWYSDPNKGPDGIYAAVDYSSRFSELALHCGYVTWQLQPDGSLAVIREEENTITKDQMAKLDTETLRKVRTQFGC